MFCPNCRAEYREGITTCADCGVPLVTELETSPTLKVGRKVDDLVTVLSTPDEATALVARSLLEAAGIPCFVRNDQLQDFIGLGRIGGYNIAVGPMAIQVGAEDAEAAREILREAELGPEANS